MSSRRVAVARRTVAGEMYGRAVARGPTSSCRRIGRRPARPVVNRDYAGMLQPGEDACFLHHAGGGVGIVRAVVAAPSGPRADPARGRSPGSTAPMPPWPIFSTSRIGYRQVGPVGDSAEVGPGSRRKAASPGCPRRTGGAGRPGTRPRWRCWREPVKEQLGGIDGGQRRGSW